jgi:nucleotide-binding universal stress UspA family protein
VQADELDKLTDKIKDMSDNDNINVNININANTTWGAGSTLSGDVFRFAQLRNAELIVVTSVLDGITRQGFIGSQVQRIINSSKVPILIIKMAEVPEYA